MSLQNRLTLSYIVFFAAALIVVDIGLFFMVRQALLSGIDSELQLGAQLVQQDFSTSNETFQAYYGTRKLITPPSVNDFGETNLYVQIYSLNGVQQARSSNMPAVMEDGMEIGDGAFANALAGSPYMDIANYNSVRMREWVGPLTFRGNTVGVVQVLRPMGEIDEALRLVSYMLVAGGVFALLTAARGGRWLTRRVFLTMSEITDTTRGIVSAEDLSRRVPVPETQDELLQLTVTINDMLARLDQQFSNQRRFLADVSHELRTPLAAMRGNIEVLDRGAARDPELLAESLTDMRSEVNRLIRMVNDLLLLAQSETSTAIRREPIELDSLLLEVHRELRPLAGGVQLRLGHEDQISAPGDRDRIKQAVLNLAANALQHTPVGGSVTLGLSRRGDMAAIEIADTGVGISQEDLPHIFDRFYRADKARTRVRGGAGLGLSIAKWIADAHAGGIEVESQPGIGSTFTLLLPLEPNALAEPTPQLTVTV